MTTNHHTAILTGANLNAAVVNNPLGQLDAEITDIISGDQALDQALFAALTEKTVSSGAITATKFAHTVDTEGDAASDNLDTINFGTTDPRLFVLVAENAARVVTLRHGIGNIYTPDQCDWILDTDVAALLFFDGTNCLLIGNRAIQYDTLQIQIDGGGSQITTGQKGHLTAPFDCTILEAELLADQSGSIVIDVWKDTYANFPPTDADSITASAPPTISSATKSQDSTLTGWTTSLDRDDILAFNVDSCTTITRVTLTIKVQKR